MSGIRGLVCALVGGAVGVAAWVIISYGIGYEIGWIAWLVGVLVGGGMLLGSGGDATLTRGLTAAGIAIVAVFVGKFLSVYLVTGDVLQEMAQEMVTEEVAISYLADEVVEEIEDRGRLVHWPEGVDPEFAMVEEDYPDEIWSEALETWELWSPPEQQQHMEWVKYHLQQNARAAQGDVAGEVLEHAFTPFDILWFGLALVSAFGIACQSGND